MATYYIKNSGSDANTGLSDEQAWAFTKLATFVPANGDVILFAKGEEFFGTLTILKSGISGAGITYGAYGTGADPVISSLKTLTGWTNHSGNVWKIAAGIPANCGVVTINGVSKEKGHWPASGYGVWDSSTFTLRYITIAADYSSTVAGTTLFTTSAAHGLSNGTMTTILGTTSYNGYYSVTVVSPTTFYVTKTYVSSQAGTLSYNTTITDAALSGLPSMVGADLVLFKSNWTIDRSEIKVHSGNTLTYSSGSANAMQTSGGQKFLIQNSLNCLTYHGAWFCDGSFFYMYLDTAPENYVIKAGSADFTVSLDRKNYNIVQDLTIEGGNLYGHHCLSSTYHTFQRCTVRHSGLTGVSVISNITTGASTNTYIDDCDIEDVNGTGIWLNSNGSTIKNTWVTGCGKYAGMGAAGGGSHYGIYSKGVGNITEYNRILNTGYIPIFWESSSAECRYNLVQNYPTLGLNDGGGIYTFESVTPQLPKKCYGNIIKDSTANGLYSDGLGNNIEFYNNLVMNVDKWGIHMNEPFNNNVHDNIFYDCGLAAIDITNQYFLSSPAAYDNIVANNTVIQASATQVLYSLQDAQANNIINFGTSDNNLFLVDATANAVFYNSYVTPSYHTDYMNFAAWKALTSKEASSVMTTKDLSKISVVFNDTKTAAAIALATPKKDLSGTVYATEITLDPFASIVLEDTIIEPIGESKFQVDGTGKFLVDGTGKHIFTLI